MIDGDAVREIKTIAQEAILSEERVFEVEGVPMSRAALHDVRPKIASPEVLEFATLASFADYVSANLDPLNPADHMIHVVSPTDVRVVSRVQGSLNQRLVYARARYVAPWPEAKDGRWWAPEEANINLQTLVTGAYDRAKVLKLIGNIRGEEIQQHEDDGFSQSVSVRAGAFMRTEADVPNPATLAPLRTFPEVEQPASPFVLRVKQVGNGVAVGFFDCDGGAWKLNAVKAVQEWLRLNVPSEFKILA